MTNSEIEKFKLELALHGYELDYSDLGFNEYLERDQPYARILPGGYASGERLDVPKELLSKDKNNETTFRYFAWEDTTTEAIEKVHKIWTSRNKDGN